MKHARERFAQARSLFHALIEELPEIRRRRLDDVAATDREMAEFVSRLLESADVQSEGTCDGLGATIAADRVKGSLVGGRYRILDLLGEGGMGDVYLAERSDDIAQKVALKILRGGGATLVGRFVRERQILARLSHPHIAHLLDGGLIETGSPWFAMEYVDGAYITEDCDRRELDVHARVRLFAQVCRAVQFAHRNLILHRDIKPSNILVDSNGAPKLLDFGIAKLLGDTAPEQFHTVAMTPAYAPPEQLRGETVTTASDIYQLGLVLYELLAGVSAGELWRRRALASTKDTKRPVPRMARAFEQSLPQMANSVARARGVASTRLHRVLSGDLGRIVVKATADDPRERYETAQAFAEDLDRWAGGLPVVAHRGSFAYRASKLVRRHAATATTVALLATGLLISSVVAVNRAIHERQQRQRAETMLAFMRDVFRQADPQNTDGANLGPADLLERAAGGLDARTDIDDVTRALLLNEIASVFESMGREDKAWPAAARAVAMLDPHREANPVEYLTSAGSLVEALRALGQSQQEIDLIERALPVARRITEGNKQWYAVFLGYRGYAQMQRDQIDAAQKSLDASITEFELAGAGPSTDFAAALYQRAQVANDRGDTRHAIEFFQRSADTQAKSADATKLGVLETQEEIGRTRCLQGEAMAGAAALSVIVAKMEALLSSLHNRTVMARTDLALCYASQGDYHVAGAVLDSVLDARRHGSALSSLQTIFIDQVATRLSLYMQRTGKALASARADAEALSRMQPPTRFVLRADWLLGESLLQANQCGEAEPLLEQSLARAHRLAGESPNALVGEIEDSLGRCSLIAGHYAPAQEHFERAIEQFRSAQTAGAPSTLRSEIHLLWCTALATHKATALDQLASRRRDLAGALGSDDRPQLWQLDILIDDLDRTFGRRNEDANRRIRAEAALKSLAQTPTELRFVGLSSFY